MLFSNIQCNTPIHSTFPVHCSLCRSAFNANSIPVGLNTVEVTQMLTLICLYVILKDNNYVCIVCMQAVSVTHTVCSVYITTKRMSCVGMLECLCEDSFNFCMLFDN